MTVKKRVTITSVAIAATTRRKPVEETVSVTY
jgi:hypothetical protein